MKRPLTEKQRLAIARRSEQHETRKQLAELARIIEQRIPEGYRLDTATALTVILHNGHVFAHACAKAAALRGAPEQWGAIPADFWPFVDRQNAEFARHMQPEIIANWNRGHFPELAAATDKARGNKARVA